MGGQLDHIEMMLKYLIIKPKLEWLEKHFQNHAQLSQQTDVPPIPGEMIREHDQLRRALPDIDSIILKDKTDESNQSARSS